MKILSLLVAFLFWLCPLAFAEDITLVTLTSKTGIEFTYYQSDLQDTVAIALAFKGGTASDPIDGPATAFLAPGQMTAGAGGKSNSELYEAFADVGGSFSLSANTDQTYAELSAPSKRIIGAATLANLVLTKPDFPQRKFEQARLSIEQRIEEINAYPETAMQKAFYLAAAEPHIYQNYFNPTVEAIRRVAVADLRPWVAKHITRKGLLVSVVGNLEFDRAREIVDVLLAGLPKNSDLPETPRMVFRPSPSEPIRISFNTGDQAIINLGMAQNFQADLKQWTAATMLSQIFSGDQKSRLFKDIREQSGATYGLQPNIAFYEAVFINGVTGRIDKNKVDETVALVKKSWDKFRAEGPTDEEISNAKANASQLFGNVSRDHARMAGMVRDYMTGHWSAAEIAKIPQLVDEIDLKDKALLAELFPENPIIVIAR